MSQLSETVIHFLQRQGCVVVSSIDSRGFPHSACKAIVKIENNGTVYLLDAYQGKTFHNLKNNPLASVTSFDEDKFAGYCLKGRARILSKEELDAEIIKAWEERIVSRLTQRLLKNIQGGAKGHPGHPEALLPKPEHMIVIDVEEVVDLTPQHLK
ncbi:MAG: pyridoxamine 5'-phosphate oxidase family protein [Candidatus Omnitrophica bacterium]|nr:pyridoxamine 5'-phosphate oxidase family protein [Candidatus Omnitrophota bacterium]